MTAMDANVTPVAPLAPIIDEPVPKSGAKAHVLGSKAGERVATFRDEPVNLVFGDMRVFNGEPRSLSHQAADAHSGNRPARREFADTNDGGLSSETHVLVPPAGVVPLRGSVKPGVIQPFVGFN